MSMYSVRNVNKAINRQRSQGQVSDMQWEEFRTAVHQAKSGLLVMVQLKGERMSMQIEARQGKGHVTNDWTVTGSVAR